MNKLCLIGAASVIAHASSVAVADSHETESPHSFSANTLIATEYLYRGITQTNEGPTIQGGFDYEYVPFGFYVGSWASNIEFNTGGNTNDASIEMNFYGGFAGELANGIGWDIGGLYYYYPDTNEDSGAGDYDFVEVYGNTSYTFSASMDPTIDAGFAYSPDFYGEDGDSIYVHGTFGFSLPHDFGFYGMVAWLDVAGDETTGRMATGGAIDGFDYVHYAIGISKEVSILTFDLSWNDTNDNCDDLLGDDDPCEAILFSVSSSW